MSKDLRISNKTEEWKLGGIKNTDEWSKPAEERRTKKTQIPKSTTGRATQQRKTLGKIFN